MNALSRFRKATPVFVIAFVLAWFALSPPAQAVVPPPDGGYPGQNTAEGQDALLHLAGGLYNTAVGWASLGYDTDGTYNTALGAGALLRNTSDRNTATGCGALLSNTTGTNNTADGAFALFNNTTGFHNTAIGLQALLNNTIGSNNTATGLNALVSNTQGNYNTATGDSALYGNTSGERNTGSGVSALASNTSGFANTAVGYFALNENTTGVYNTAVGYNALLHHTTGSTNTALGIGACAAVTTASNVTCIGASTYGENVNGTAWIGNVYGVTTQSGTTAPVIVSDNGQLGTVASSKRFKKDVANMGKASEAIMSLRPVTFHYKTDTKGTPQFGLIAEEVAKVSPALVLPDKDGKPYTVRYEAVNAMLLNEFLKEQKKMQEQGATIARLEKQIEALTAGLQKVSVHLELSELAPQTVLNNQ